MSQKEITAADQDPARLLELKGEIMVRWARLPAEHQATTLWILLDRSTWAPWSIAAWVATHPEGGESHDH